MAISLLTIVLAAASIGGGGVSGAQAAYMRCLSTELDAAVVRRIDVDRFADGVSHVCESETALYKRMAVASIVGSGADSASPAAADKRFEDFDRANRLELIDTFQERMKLRRGPSRVAGLPGADAPAVHD